MALNTPFNQEIAIIGAGLAGLTTAYHLHKAGLDVHVYEAKNRLGGRIFTVDVNGIISEFGGKNIADGGSAPHMRNLIKELGLQLIEEEGSISHFYFDGNRLIPQSELAQAIPHPQLLRHKLMQAASNSHTMREVLDTLLDPSEPLYQVLSVRLAAYEGASIDKLSSFYTSTLYNILLGILMPPEKALIQRVSIQGGNSLLPEKIGDLLGNRIHLNTPLIAVDYVNKKYVLTFENEYQVQADILVLAIPCSVYTDITFTENVIPKKRLKTIQAIPYGTNAKILVPFPSPLSRDTTLINNHTLCFFDTSADILTLYSTGEEGCFSSETLYAAYQREQPMMQAAFGTLCPPEKPLSYAQDIAFSSYTCATGYSWPNDPYIKGSYAYIGPGQEILFTTTEQIEGETVKTLFKPIQQTLYFVGEHTSSIPQAGTMEAACDSGEKAARMILKATKLF